MPKREAEHGLVASFQPAHEDTLALVLEGSAVVSEEQVAQRGDGRERHGQRRENRGDVRNAQRREDASFESGEEEDRKKDDGNDERRVDYRVPNLARGLEHHVDCGRRLRALPIQSQAPKHVFDIDDGVVDDLANGDRQAPERHRIDPDAERVERQDAAQEGGRD